MANKSYMWKAPQEKQRIYKHEGYPSHTSDYIQKMYFKFVKSITYSNSKYPVEQIKAMFISSREPLHICLN